MWGVSYEKPSSSYCVNDGTSIVRVREIFEIQIKVWLCDFFLKHSDMTEWKTIKNPPEALWLKKKKKKKTRFRECCYRVRRGRWRQLHFGQSPLISLVTWLRPQNVIGQDVVGGVGDGQGTHVRSVHVIVELQAASISGWVHFAPQYRLVVLQSGAWRLDEQKITYGTHGISRTDF